jgi:RNA polymerase sigma-70 factor (ECF subfamily)
MSTRKPSDEDLMRLMGEGHDLALNDLMKRWQKPLLSFTNRYTQNTSEAADLAQETFVKVYQNRAKYRHEGTFSTWMFTIAVNLCRNHARWKSRHPSLSSAEADAELRVNLPTDAATRPDSQSIRGDDASKVREAIQDLSHDLRTAILLFEYEGLSHTEIAVTLDCSAKAVETRLYRARQILREKLKDLL